MQIEIDPKTPGFELLKDGQTVEMTVQVSGMGANMSAEVTEIEPSDIDSSEDKGEDTDAEGEATEPEDMADKGADEASEPGDEEEAPVKKRGLKPKTSKDFMNAFSRMEAQGNY